MLLIRLVFLYNTSGGRTSYLLERINDTGFCDTMLSYIRDNGFVIGVSAGSLIFANNLMNNLGLLDTKHWWVYDGWEE